MRIELKCGCGASAVFDDAGAEPLDRAVMPIHKTDDSWFPELDDNGDRWLVEKRAREWQRTHADCKAGRRFACSVHCKA